MSGHKDTDQTRNARIALLARTMEANEIAVALKLPQREVEAVLDRLAAQRGTSVRFRCNRTGRERVAPSWRSAYLRAQILGLSDWDWCLERARGDQ